MINFLKWLFNIDDQMYKIEFGNLCVGANFWYKGVRYVKTTSCPVSYTNACKYYLQGEETVFGDKEIVLTK